SASVSEDKEVQADLVRQYAEDGYDLIMGHGGEYRSAFETVSEEYPNIQFALVTSHPGNNKNLGGLAVRADESGYLAGVLAALKTETGKVAYIGGEVYPSTTEEATAFEKGAKDTNPEVTVSIVWVESWSDQRKAQGIAEDLVADDIDVLAVDADLAGLAALQVAEKEGIMAIGWVSDQSSQAPNAIIGSVVQNMSARMTEAAVLVEKGRWEGKQYRMGIQEGVIDLIVVDGVLTAEEDTQIATIKDDIITGQVDTLP
ncbi:MAG: BMP family protein, partial [Chloroflexota bacterium]